MTGDDPRPACAAVLASAGLAGAFSVRPIPGGGNNRVYRVDRDGPPLLLKSYFRHGNDARDRLGAEFAFARFAWACGSRSVPEPVACDPALRVGLFEFVEGRRLSPGEVDGDAVGRALAFFRELNLRRGDPDARALPDGSEACFATRDHLACVDRRVERLSRLEPASAADREAAAFVRGPLAVAWERVRGGVRRAAPDEAPLPAGDRCVSPSDFGYHNALREPGGRLRFLDFEYAGWDDPAKVVCDFFCQPAVPVAADHFEAFAGGVAAVTSDPDRHRERFARLLPVYRVKWCCILLNDFLPAGGERRRFAGAAADREAAKAEQLRKARAALEALA